MLPLVMLSLAESSTMSTLEEAGPRSSSVGTRSTRTLNGWDLTGTLTSDGLLQPTTCPSLICARITRPSPQLSISKCRGLVLFLSLILEVNLSLEVTQRKQVTYRSTPVTPAATAILWEWVTWVWSATPMATAQSALLISSLILCRIKWTKKPVLGRCGPVSKTFPFPVATQRKRVMMSLKILRALIERIRRLRDEPTWLELRLLILL